MNRGDRVERARLYRHPSEQFFGVQIATNAIEEGVRAAAQAQEAGAAWVDLNCGCPIHEATKRGLGAAMLRRPAKLARLVNGIVARISLPLTVKIRTGENDKKVNAPQVAETLEAAGAAAVIIHGRTMEQRYKKAADWGLISDIASQRSLPVIANGDLLTHFELRDKAAAHPAVHAAMVGRGALIKPWIFQEVREGRELQLDAAERVGVYRKLASYFKEHFRDDARGRKGAFYFWPWHFNFFHRARPLPEDVYGEQSRQAPLISMRADMVDAKIGETREGLGPVELLLRCEHEQALLQVAELLYDATSDADAVAGLERLSREHLEGWEAEVRAGRRGSADADAMAEG